MRIKYVTKKLGADFFCTLSLFQQNYIFHHSGETMKLEAKLNKTKL